MTNRKIRRNKKLILIGIDGGTFSVLKPLFDKKLLPNLNSLENKGILKTVMPPVTAPAWASFLTGNKPGKTEIYDFTIIDNKSWKIDFINREKLKGKPLWKYLDESGVKSCFMNIPLTYPPEKINGVMISGMETPTRIHNYTYPISLKKELKKFDYEIEVSGLKSKKEEIVKEAIKILDKRIRVAKYLFEKKFDFFLVFFRASDIAQHYAWNKKEVEIIYKKIDNFIGEIRNKGDMIVISDHGFEKLEKAFNANAWLEKEGYLKTKINKGKASLLSVLGINKERIFNILNKLRLMFLIKIIPRRIGKKIPAGKIYFEEAIARNLIDFSKTKAIAKRAVKCVQIYFNTEKRGGIVKEDEEEKLKIEIKEKLERFFAKENVEVEIWTDEELYDKKAEYAPDITIYLKEKSCDSHCFISQNKKIWVETIPNADAIHNTEGIILSNLNLKLENAEIIDLAPTILKYFGIKKGKFDGKSLL